MRTDEDPYYVSRSMPRFWRWYLRMFPVTLVTAVALSIWRDSDWYLFIPVSVIAALLLHLHYFVCCPRCSRRLRPRVVKERWRAIAAIFTIARPVGSHGIRTIEQPEPS
jgi:hypothetical protein